MDPLGDRLREPIRPAAPVDFDEVIDDVIDDLPEAFAAQLGSVAIVVEDEASEEQLAAVRAAGLYGLYQGVPRTRFGVDNVPIPSKITLFRGPLLRANASPDRLRLAIEDTLLHEIAHHFGIDDARLHALRAAGRASRISSAERRPHAGDGGHGSGSGQGAEPEHRHGHDHGGGLG